MPRPKNYSFEKAQRERSRLAKKAARKDAKSAKGDGVVDPEAVGQHAEAVGQDAEAIGQDAEAAGEDQAEGGQADKGEEPDRG